MIGLLCFALAVLASPFDHVRPCNLKPRQRDLTPVLRRPVEPAPQQWTFGNGIAVSQLPTTVIQAD